MNIGLEIGDKIFPKDQGSMIHEVTVTDIILNDKKEFKYKVVITGVNSQITGLLGEHGIYDAPQLWKLYDLKRWWRSKLIERVLDEKQT